MLFRRRKRSADFPPVPEVDGPIFAVGDIHGRLDLFDRAIALIAREDPRQDAQIVLLGDYVDRGPHSRQVVERLLAWGHAGLVCLMGNHERMMLDFLEEPDANAPWLTFGGADTLNSYGVETPDIREVADLATAFRAAVPRSHVDFLSSLLLSWHPAPGLFVSHAGANPEVALDAQTERDLLWGNSAFLKRPRTDGVWVLHGHWARSRPEMSEGRMGIDTGAYYSDVLTIAHITPEECRFLSA